MLCILLVLIVVLITICVLFAVCQLGRRMSVRRRVSSVGLHFFAGVSRRLHAPLALVTNPIRRILGGSGLPRSIHRRLIIMREGAGHVLHLIGRVLSFHGVRGGGVGVRIRHISIISFIHGIVSGFRTMTRRRQVSFLFRARGRRLFL